MINIVLQNFKFSNTAIFIGRKFKILNKEYKEIIYAT